MKFAQARPSIVIVILAIAAAIGVGPHQLSGSQVNFNPNQVSPYGITLHDVYGTLTPIISDNMGGWNVCANAANPSSAYGVSCNNGVNDGTFIFNVTGFETTQGFYEFILNSFGNGTIALKFLGLQPGITSASGSVVQSSTYANGIETLLDSGSSSTGTICVAYTNAGCSSGQGGNNPSGGGGGGGGSSGSGGTGPISTIITAASSPVGTIVTVLFIMVLAILLLGVVAVRRRAQRS